MDKEGVLDESNPNKTDEWKKLPVVHHQNFQLLDIVHHKFLEAVGKEMAGLLVWAITNVGHQSNSFELPPHTRINTLGSTPALLSNQIEHSKKWDTNTNL